MKTTIKLTQTRRITVEPCRQNPLIELTVQVGDKFTSSEAVYLTPDQAGALIFGLEQALETMEAAERIAA